MVSAKGKRTFLPYGMAEHKRGRAGKHAKLAMNNFSCRGTRARRDVTRRCKARCVATTPDNTRLLLIARMRAGIHRAIYSERR